MAGESQYYNPIIEAMANTARLNQQRERDVEAAKQAKEDLALRTAHQTQQQKEQDRQYDLKSKEHDRLAEEHKLTIKNATDIANSLIEQRKIQALKNVREGMAAGIGKEAFQDPGQEGTSFLPGLIPNMGATSGNMVRVGDRDIPASAFPTPTSEAERIRGLAQAKNDPLVAGRKEVQQQGIEGRKDLANINNDTSMQRTILNAQSREKINQLTNDTRSKIVGATLKAHQAMGGLGDPNAISNTVNDTYITGNTPFNSIPSKTREVLRNSLPSGWTPIDPKDKPKLDNVNVVKDILDLGTELSDYSYDKNPTEALKSVAGMGQTAALRNRLEALSGQLAEVFGKEGGRKTEDDIKRAKKLLFSPSLQSSENLKNVQEATKIYKDILNSTLSKYNKDQLDGILSSRGIDPSLVISEKGTMGTIKKNVAAPKAPNNDPLGIR